MSWILEQLSATRAGQPPEIRCNIRQAMEWFILALKGVSAETVRNCWVATKILTPAQMNELETGIRHNNRPAETRVRGLAGVA